MFQIFVYIPESHLEKVKNAMFSAGAGQLGDYDSCAWQVRGEGQFRPLSGSAPFLGETDQLEKVSEYRIELLCSDEKLGATLKAMRSAHPYEEPAFGVVKLHHPE